MEVHNNNNDDKDDDDDNGYDNEGGDDRPGSLAKGRGKWSTTITGFDEEDES